MSNMYQEDWKKTLHIIPNENVRKSQQNYYDIHFLQIFGKACADNEEPGNFTGSGPVLEVKVSHNGATSGPKTSEFQSGHKVIKKRC